MTLSNIFSIPGNFLSPFWHANEPAETAPPPQNKDETPPQTSILSEHYPNKITFITQIACTIQGLDQVSDDLKKTVWLAKCFFAAFALGSVILYAFFTSRIALGVGAIGTLASAVYGYYIHTQIAPVEFWKEGFDKFRKGDINQAVDHMKGALIENHSKTPDVYKKFKEAYYRGFYCHDLRDIFPGSQEMIIPVFGSLLLYRALYAMKSGDVSDETYSQLQQDVELAQSLFQSQRCGIQENQEIVCDFFKLKKIEVKRAIEAAKITLPQSFSVGHGMLVQIYSWLKRSQNHLKEDVSMESTGVGIEHLDVWQSAAKQAKIWFEKSGDYQNDSIEKQVIEGILASNNMQELLGVILGDLKGNLDYFINKAS